MKLKVLILMLVGFQLLAAAQDFRRQPNRKIIDRKRSIYLDSGVIHTNDGVAGNTLLAIRHSYSAATGLERLVFDFDKEKTPKIYGYISSNDNKLYLDFFQTKIDPKIGSFGSSRFVKELQFFQIGKESLPIEITFKKASSVEVFTLNQPGKKARVVVDIKN